MMESYKNKKISQVYKILPLFEQEKDWMSKVNLLAIEFSGLYKSDCFSEEEKAILLEIVGKLYSLEEILDHKLFRKTVFDIISLIERV